MRFVGAAALVLLAVHAMAQQAARVERGRIRLEIPTGGAVVADHVITLKSTIPGRVEDMLVSSTDTWILNSAPMGHVASRELTSLLDSPTTTDRAEVLEHWKSMFPLIPINCPGDCYLLETLVYPREWIPANTVMFKTTQHLDLRGTVKPRDTRWIRDGQWLEFWAKTRPERVFRLPLANFTLNNPEDPQNSAGSFSVDMTPFAFLPPGTQWEGVIIPIVHENALKVPTAALITFNHSIYLPVRVSTGITQGDWTEITAGVEAWRPILILDDSQLKKAVRQISETPPPPSKKPAEPASIDYGRDIYSQ